MLRGSVLAASGVRLFVTNMLDVEMSVFNSSDRQMLNNSRAHLFPDPVRRVLARSLSSGKRCYE